MTSKTVFHSRREFGAYRIGSPAHPLLDGAGAATSDEARWNSRSRYVIYASEHYATALLEKAAQLNSIKIPRTLMWVRINIPAGAIMEEVRPEELLNWDADYKETSRRFGNRWYDDARSLVLLVPSMAAPRLERNLLINQHHPQFARVTATTPESIGCHPRLLV